MHIKVSETATQRREEADRPSAEHKRPTRRPPAARTDPVDLLPRFGHDAGRFEENAAFAKKFDLPYTLLCDVDREIGLAYGACDEPNAGYADRITYIIDEDGFISQAFSHVETRTHPAKVLESVPPSPAA